MKVQIYAIVLATIIITGFTLLLLYYTQDFSEDFDLEYTIPFWNIQLDTSISNQVEYLNSATLRVGTLTLENNGIFSQTYTFPQLVGCVNVHYDNGETGFFQDKLVFDFVLEDAVPDTSPKYYYDDKKVRIRVGDEETFNVVGVLSSYGRPLSEFYEPHIDSITIFRVDSKESNPFDFGYSRSKYYYTSCEDLFLEYEPLHEVQLT